MVLKKNYFFIFFLILFILGITCKTKNFKNYLKRCYKIIKILFFIAVKCSIRENIKKIFSHKNETQEKDEATSFLDEIINKIITKKNQLTDIPKILKETLKEQLKEKLNEELKYIF